ncbi:MAG: DUF1127 domain-containing protein [Alphaproteobacteria bacterium]|jgi:uncharacterized protein YjiS (DUF1127 family)|nr:DUF1127 domain-containing protein [Alphaproteobacteria bacterium]
MSSLVAQAFHALAERYANWRERQQAYAELTQLDDRSLADIGISRAEIPYVLSQPRPSRAPIWARSGRHSHAH